jgi:1-pyrroline-5-carboxylate dehydrogenase
MNGNDKGYNLVQGKWVGTAAYNDLLDPLTGKPLMKVPATTKDETEPFI